MPQRRTIANHASSEAVEPGVLRALPKLNYQVIPAASAADLSIQVDLRIVEEESLSETPGEEPIIVLVREPGLESSDLRVVTLLLRPATLNGLYTFLQSALERTPRNAPRIATGWFPARCRQDDQFWPGAVVSLSATGCLFRIFRGGLPPAEITLVFQLPSDAMVSTRARPVRWSNGAVGLAFQDIGRESRSAIELYVMGRLSA